MVLVKDGKGKDKKVQNLYTKFMDDPMWRGEESDKPVTFILKVAYSPEAKLDGIPLISPRGLFMLEGRVPYLSDH